MYVKTLRYEICINVFIPEVRMMSEQAVRILRNIPQRSRQTLDVHPVTTLPSCGADLSAVGRNCIGPEKVGCLLLLYMRLYCVVYISDMPKYPWPELQICGCIILAMILRITNVCADHDVELQACHIYCCIQLTFRSCVLKMYLRILKYGRISVDMPHTVLTVLLKRKKSLVYENILLKLVDGINQY